MVKKYSAKELFSYSGVSPVRIVIQSIKFLFYKVIGKRNVIATVNDYKMKLDLGTPGLSKVLFVYGSRELPDIHVAKSILREGMVVADIGANIGYYSLLEAKAVGTSGHVYAFEPDPRNTPLLRENISLNNMEDRVTIFEEAVSNKKERKTFQLGERTNVSSFVDRPDVVGSVEVDCIALHEFQLIVKVDMLRMDAEGYECKIIEGVLPFLKKNTKPFHIMLEVHPHEYNDSDLNIKARLKELFEIGFTASHVIANKGVREFFTSRGYQSSGTWQETKHTRDLYLDVSNEDAITAIEERCIRAMVLTRK